ncbi:hypothetical protein RJ639_017576 [Escallonia herrerae]|uniref:BHLH domain-containing protein n=1 Tax=Escallonia herrerae TaxID=1293975 RepID=A0AA88VCM2_9ASTE|nr:hypothetical protein RJ639_017576 [Escallonia herrerae]
MATGQENLLDAVVLPQEHQNLRKQLALAVKGIQWSYAIFWSISSRQPGVLEWGDGYYNGDIKTRKTIQAVEFDADHLGLQRTEQLRELYESLSTAETNPQARRPSAALSPEDLTDAEWYFLVCMSFVFNIGQGLPGRTLANNKTIWLHNAHYADSKVFTRSLLAKTVVCFPCLGGVVELGISELVLEDPKVIQHMKASFLDIPYQMMTSKCVSEAARIEKDFVYPKLDQDIMEYSLHPVVECEDVNLHSPNDGSNGFELKLEEPIMFEGASQVQSWQFNDDEFSNCVQTSMSSSDCISQAALSPEKDVPVIPSEQKENNDRLVDFQECSHTTLASFDSRKNDIHYQSVLSTLFKTSHPLVIGPGFQNSNNVSCFISWKKGGMSGRQIAKRGTPQRLLKKVLFEVAQMHGKSLLKSREANERLEELSRPEADDLETYHVLSERRRREKINDRFSVLGSLVPSAGKVDKVSLLDGTIEYLKELEGRVKKLESSKERAEMEVRTQRKPHDVAERTSDNYGNDKNGNSRKPLVNKRKACDIDEIEAETNQVLPKDDSLTDDLTVSVIDRNVLVEIRCPWKEGLLLEIMDATSKLHLDSHSVQTSSVDGILSLTIRSKLKGSPPATIGMIRQALRRVIQNG